MYNLSFRTLRFYEEKELLQPRRVGVSRLYSVRDKIRLELVLTGRRLGFTLAEIWELIHSRLSDTHRETADLSEALEKPEIERQIDLLKQRRTALDEAICELTQARERFERSGGPVPLLVVTGAGVGADRLGDRKGEAVAEEREVS